MSKWLLGALIIVALIGVVWWIRARSAPVGPKAEVPATRSLQAHELRRCLMVTGFKATVVNAGGH
jgi:hypothetical protein